MPIAARLTLALFASLLLVLLPQALVRVEREQAAVEKDMARDHRRLGQGLAAAVAELWEEGGEETADELVKKVKLGAVSVALRDVKAALDDPQLRQKEKKEHLYTRVPVVLSGGDHVAWLDFKERLPREKPFVRRALSSVAGTWALAALVYTALAALLGWMLIGRHVDRLVKKTKRIAQGDLSPDLDDKSSNEFGALAGALNHLCRRLDDAGVQLGEAESRALQLAAERDDAVRQLLHADRLAALGQLTASVAHELGSPLTVIAGRAQAIARGRTKDEERIRQSAAIIDEQAQRTSRIIRNMLDFSRREPSSVAQADVGALLADWLVVLAPLAKRGSVELALDAPGAPVHLDVDAALLQQVITNLVLNGVQAQPEGGEVRLWVEEDDDSVAIHVRDRGPGIRDDDKVRVFEPFFTTKDAGEGTGLGLSVVQEIITQHHGHLDVVTPEDGGCDMVVVLPKTQPRSGA